MLHREDHDLLVSRLYASALGETSWAETLSFGAGLFRSEAAVFRINGPDGQPVAAENTRYDPDFALNYYFSEIYANDPRSRYLERSAPGKVYYDHMLYDVETIYRDPWCKAACDVLEVTYQLGLTLDLPNGCSGHLAFLTNDSQGHASREAIAAFQRIAPHIEQAGTLGHVIEMGGATRAALLEALAQKADGIVLLGRDARPVFMNGAAEAILRSGDGLAWTRGAFVTGRPPETRRLQRLIIEALSNVDRPGGRMLVTRRSGRLPYAVSVSAAPPTERFLASGAIACVVHIHDLAAARLTVTVPANFVDEMQEQYTNCASVAGVVNGQPLLESIPFDNNRDCATVTPTTASPPRLTIEKVVEGDCTGSPPSTLCKFVIRIFNPGQTPYTGPLTFTDTVTSFGNLTGGVSLSLPLPPGWSCSGPQPTTCSSNGPVTIPGNNGHIAVPLYLTIAGPVPPTQNCASLTAPVTASPSCVPLGSTHYNLGLDANFLAPTTQPVGPPKAELDYVISANPALPVGSQVIVTGSLTGGTIFSPWILSGASWTCSGTWASFLCSHTVTPTSFSTGFLWLRMKTDYPGLDIGNPFAYTGTVSMTNNVDLVGSNNTYGNGGLLP